VDPSKNVEEGLNGNGNADASENLEEESHIGNLEEQSHTSNTDRTDSVHSSPREAEENFCGLNVDSGSNADMSSNAESNATDNADVSSNAESSNADSSVSRDPTGAATAGRSHPPFGEGRTHTPSVTVTLIPPRVRGPFRSAFAGRGNNVNQIVSQPPLNSSVQLRSAGRSASDSRSASSNSSLSGEDCTDDCNDNDTDGNINDYGNDELNNNAHGNKFNAHGIETDCSPSNIPNTNNLNYDNNNYDNNSSTSADFSGFSPPLRRHSSSARIPDGVLETIIEGSESNRKLNGNFGVLETIVEGSESIRKLNGNFGFQWQF
jgi:hypothetical protein